MVGSRRFMQKKKQKKMSEFKTETLLFLHADISKIILKCELVIRLVIEIL